MERAKTIVGTCSGCGKRFEAVMTRAKFCSGRCRVASWKTRKVQEAVDQAVEAALAEAARRVLKSNE